MGHGESLDPVTQAAGDARGIAVLGYARICSHFLLLMSKDIHYHFSTIAPKYTDLRTADIQPILFIKKELQQYKKIEAADIGCGTGRYDLKAFQHFGKKLYLRCVDCNEEMLNQLSGVLYRRKIKNFRVINSYAEKLPFKDASLDCIFAFNAIHHFKLLEFLREGSRVLREDGWMFLYTRLRSQNRRNIWGRYFPLFTQKETRLYEFR